MSKRTADLTPEQRKKKRTYDAAYYAAHRKERLAYSAAHRRVTLLAPGARRVHLNGNAGEVAPENTEKVGQQPIKRFHEKMIVALETAGLCDGAVS